MIESEKVNFVEGLKKARIDANIEITEISDKTKIKPEYFEAIEDGNFDLLPDVYMRLFLRSYTREIGMDDVVVLEQYEKITGRDRPDDLYLPADPLPEQHNDMDQISFMSRQKIIYSVAAVIILFATFYFLNYLTSSEQIGSIEGSTITTVQNDASTVTEPTAPSFSPLPDLAKLNDADFSRDKFISEESRRLQTRPPFTFRLSAKTQTKVYIKGGGQIVNEILEANAVREIVFSDTLKFDLWSANHLRITVNDIEMNNYLTENDVAVRGSIVSDGSLYYRFYQH